MPPAPGGSSAPGGSGLADPAPPSAAPTAVPHAPGGFPDWLAVPYPAAAAVPTAVPHAPVGSGAGTLADRGPDADAGDGNVTHSSDDDNDFD